MRVASVGEEKGVSTRRHLSDQKVLTIRVLLIQKVTEFKRLIHVNLGQFAQGLLERSLRPVNPYTRPRELHAADVPQCEWIGEVQELVHCEGRKGLGGTCVHREDVVPSKIPVDYV